MKAILSGWLYVSLEYFADLKAIKKELTFKPKKLGDSLPVPIRMYSEEREGYLGVPPYWGIENLDRVLLYPKQYLDIISHLTEGKLFASECKKPDHNHLSVKDPDAQKQFLEDLTEYVEEESYPIMFRAQAGTGTGKTVCASWIAGGVLKRKTLILSHMLRLSQQWLETFRDILGVPEERIGIVDGTRKDWRDKDVVISTLQTIALHPGSMPEEFYKEFGVIIFDEVHKAGAPHFCQAAWQFPAAIRIGLSATHERKDGAHKVIENFLGPIAVTSQQAALPIRVYPVWYTAKGKLWGDNHGARMLCLSRDDARNVRIAGLIKKAYDGGRQGIIVSESIKHLEHLMDMCIHLGIPKEIMGQFTATKNVMETVQAGERLQTVRKKKTQKASELERIKKESQLLFCSYGMIKEGIDIPRLDFGLAATPRTDGIQLIGRLRRPHEGKKSPVLWIDIVDKRCDRSLRYHKCRLKDYDKCNADVVNLND